MIESSLEHPQMISQELFLGWSRLAIGYFNWLAKAKTKHSENPEQIIEGFRGLATVSWRFSQVVAEWQDAIIAAGRLTGYSEFRPLGVGNGETYPIARPTDHECLAAALSFVVRALSRDKHGSVDPGSIEEFPAWSRDHSEEIRVGFQLLEFDSTESNRMIASVIRERSTLKTSISFYRQPVPDLVSVKEIAEMVFLERKSMHPYEKQWKTKPANRPGKQNGRRGKLYPRAALVTELEKQFPQIDFSDWKQ